MVKWSAWSYILILTTLAASSPELQTGLGMKLEPRPKRQPSEADDDHQMVTIDLSALRPSLPGLVLYKYGEHAPKLVQIDLSALNPQLQPHVIWPQFDQMELFNDRSLDFDSLDAIPYLTDEESLISPKPPVAKMTMAMTDDNSWAGMDDITDGDIYDFIPDSSRNNELMSLHGSLPLADEVIVPLDWEEEKVNRNSNKRNVFVSRGWKARGQGDVEKMEEKNSGNPASEKASGENFNVHYTPFGTTNWIPGKRKDERETESEEETSKSTTSGQLGKKNVFVSSGWGPGGQQVSMAGARRHAGRRRMDGKPQTQPMRISSQESWSLPRQYWNVPHLIGGNWQ